MTTDSPVAVVTGGNRGIGFEVCRQLADLGYEVVLGSRNPARGTQVAKNLNHQNVTPCQLDVSDDESVRQAAAWVRERFGRCDVLVNNAGILYDSSARASAADLATVRDAMETNFYGAWRTTLAFLPMLRAAEHGRIVNVSSQAASLSGMGAGTPAYGTSKAALNALTRKLAAELRPDGVLANAVCPGWTATDMGGGGRPVPEGAASVVWGVTLPDDGPTGGFFRDGMPLPW